MLALIRHDFKKVKILVEGNNFPVFYEVRDFHFSVLAFLERVEFVNTFDAGSLLSCEFEFPMT
jgi:hypothetical protein